MMNLLVRFSTTLLLIFSLAAMLMSLPLFALIKPERPAIQLATIYHSDIDLQAFWISEKLDGVRAYWTGKQLISRQGHVFNAPAWFTEDFPAVPLDGELWIGRQQFERVSGIVRQKNGDGQGWRTVKLMIFDLPQSSLSFSYRIVQMQGLVSQANSPYLQMIEQFKVDSEQQLSAKLDAVIKQGGEGLMLHRGEARYQAQRSPDLMKLKRYSDAEAVVVAHLAGKGKYQGQLGAILVRTAEGITFKIGSGFSDQERREPHQLAALLPTNITVRPSITYLALPVFCDSEYRNKPRSNLIKKCVGRLVLCRSWFIHERHKRGNQSSLLY